MTTEAVTNGAVEFARENGGRFVEELKAFLRIPSISTDPERAGDVRRAAEFAASELKRIGMQHVELIETTSEKHANGHPLVYADYLMAAGKTTVLLYGHYDVQPPDPLDEWKSPPFEPTERDGNLYARGAVDDKGQMWMHVKALEALFAAGGGALPVNVRVILEGEEEVGGEGIAAFVREHPQRLAADVALVSDTEMFAPDLPTLCVGLRGMIYTEIEARGARTDLHSGMYGGAAPNPFFALAHIIAKLKDESGKILIPGFYDAVAAPDAAELKAWKALPFDEEHYRETEVGSTELTGEPGFSVLERTWARPTLEVHGMPGGFTGAGAKTVIPARALAKVSMRLVPDQTPAEAFAQYKAYVESLCPAGITLEVRLIHAGDPVVVSTDNPYVRAATDAMHTVFGTDTLFVRGGGSIPIVGDFIRELKTPTLLMGFGLPDDNLHAPNEKFHLANFHRGIESIIRFLGAVGELMGEALASAVGGYVLAGGRSSRMGTDKALLELAGRPLIEHAVTKLHRVYGDVHILSGNAALARYAPLVSDLHADCGPIGGMEAALESSAHAWNLFLGVDMPFVPAAFLQEWVSRCVGANGAARICLFSVEGRPQPGLCLLHREILPYLRESIEHGDYKLMRVFAGAAAAIAVRLGVAADAVLELCEFGASELMRPAEMGAAQWDARELWFANVNTPEEFAAAKAHLSVLDLSGA